MPCFRRSIAHRPSRAQVLLHRAAFATLFGLLAASAGLTDAHAGISRGDRYAGAPWGSRSPVIAQQGMIASEQPLASLAGIEILKKGGSAVDAAIATSAMLCLTEPVLNGLGADAFVIVWDPKTHKLYGYNGSG
ncbi:MAG: gamma-glutamyltransferase, partial [Rhodanobacteraceae bacterium]